MAFFLVSVGADQLVSGDAVAIRRVCKYFILQS